MDVFLKLVQDKYPELSLDKAEQFLLSIIDKVIDKLDADPAVQDLVAKINLDEVKQIASGEIPDIPLEKRLYWQQLLQIISTEISKKINAQ